MKKILIFLSVLSIMLSLPLSAIAEGSFGTYEEGIIPKGSNYPPLHTPYTGEGGLPNFDFEKGLEYWSSSTSRAPTEVVKLCREENGNTYIKLDVENTGEGIESVSFKENRIREGDELCIVYSWRGENPNFDMYCNQVIYKNAARTQYETQFVTWTGDARRTEIIVGEDGGWNTAYCRFDKLVKAPYSAAPDYYFNLGVRVYDDITCDAEIDNIILARRNSTSNIIYSLDGEILFDLRNFRVEEKDEPIDASRLPEIDYNISYDDVYGEKSEDAPDSPDTVIWVIIAASAAIIAVATVLIIIGIKRRKTK